MVRIKIFGFLINFFRLTRPLSNVKNIALVLAAFYIFGGKLDFFKIIIGTISLSLICSANYAYNTLSDYEADKINKNKEHYSKAIEYFGKRNSKIIVFLLTLLGYIAGFLINIYFLASLVFLSLAGFLYSSKKIRFKEKIILDTLFGAVFTFFLRFAAAWLIFSETFPPVLALLGLVSAKTAGYLLYKEADRPFLEKLKIKNSITFFSKKAIIITSIIMWVIAIASFVFMCLNSGIYRIRFLGVLPMKILFLMPFAIPPLLVIYLSVFGKIKIKIKNLRTLGFIYWILVIIFAILFL